MVQIMFRNPLISGAHGRSYLLKQTCSFQLQVYVSMNNLLVGTRR